MREQCGSGDGPRMNEGAAEDSKCDCHDALEKLLNEVERHAFDAGFKRGAQEGKPGATT